MDALAGDYRHTIMDNEAGLEHLSRRTTRTTDVLLVISDASMRGLTAARRVLDLADEMKLDVGEKMFVLNRATPEAAAALMPEIERLRLPLAATLLPDPGLFDLEVAGRALLELPDDAVCVDGTTPLFDKIFAAS